MRTTAGSRRMLILVVVVPLLVAGYLQAPRREPLPECPHDWDFTKIQITTKERQLVTLHTLKGPLSVSSASTNECSRVQRLSATS